MRGYFDRYLDVDLSKGVISDYGIPEEWQEAHIGGRGVAARILLEELEVGVDPLGPRNILIFATGPFQGFNIAGAGRHLLMAKSPKTGTVNGSYVGGYLGRELGRSGYDGIILRGKAERPKYLLLKDGKAQLKEAAELRGMETAEVEDWLRSREGEVRVASIGPAGEKCVKFACVMHDRNRAAGRPGLGAVMGSKNFKALAVRGGQEKQVMDRGEFDRLRSKHAQRLAERGEESFGKLGTARTVNNLNELGILPTKNFREGKFDAAEEISGERMYDTILVERDTCAGCPIRCKRVVKTEYDGQKVDPRYGGPEYETLAALGSLCMVSDLDAVALGNQKCNQYGLDTISTGVTVAFAMEASERGLLDEEIEWGNPKQMLHLIDQIARREGVGDCLASGIDQLAEEWGADFAMEIKGQEVPMHDPRGKKAVGISYATTPRGANHMEGVHDEGLESGALAPDVGITENVSRFDYSNKAKISKTFEDLQSFGNSLIACAFTADLVGHRYAYEDLRNLLEAVTGTEMDSDRMLRVGERNYLLLRLLSGREGHTAEWDSLPSRFEDPLPRGNSQGANMDREEFGPVLEEYYRLRGYDEHGPTPEKLERMGLEEFQSLVKRE